MSLKFNEWNINSDQTVGLAGNDEPVSKLQWLIQWDELIRVEDNQRFRSIFLSSNRDQRHLFTQIRFSFKFIIEKLLKIYVKVNKMYANAPS